jgi:hypothetical protein
VGEKSEIVTYQRSRFWWRQSCSQSVDGDEGAFEPLYFAVYEQLWLTYKLLQPTASRRSEEFFMISFPLFAHCSDQARSG